MKAKTIRLFKREVSATIISDIAAPNAGAVFEDVFMAIGAGGPRVFIGDVPIDAEIVDATPTSRFASRGAAVIYPIAVSYARDGV